MIADHGWWSVAPPALTIALALGTRRVLPSLLAGVLASHAVLLGTRFYAAPFEAVEQMVATTANRDNLILIAFSVMVGGLLQLIRAGRGFEGFAAWVDRLAGGAAGIGTAYGLNWVIGFGLFLDTWSNVLVSGATTAPLYDRRRFSRLRLAYFIHTIGICIVSASVLNGWGAFYIGLLNAQHVAQPLAFIVETLPLLAYHWISLALVIVVMATGWTLGPLRRFEAELAAGTGPGGRRVEGASGAVDVVDTAASVPPSRAVFLLLPVAVLLATVFGTLWVTGGGDVLKGDSSLAILFAILLSSTAAGVLLLTHGLQGPVQIEETFVAGMARFVDVGLLIVLALSVGELTRSLGTGHFVAALVSDTLPGWSLPALVFVVGAVMSFATGTSYGTFSIMLPIALPLSAAAHLDPHLMFAAVLCGGLWGDNTSPISDTTIMSSLGAEVRVIDHVATQLPYAALAGGLAFVAFLVMGAVL